ncbi:hypothetical protein IFR05_002745 [Cadophora sp. M221]|nr:hypothetical protein IFR05_002745 [Cadophora sp. M221]
MDDEDFSAWKICWQVNLLFYKRVSEKPQKCIVCSQSKADTTGTLRSSFWVEATTCSGGHRQVISSETQLAYSLGVCATCDQKYMLDVVKGKHRCRRDDCRRIVRVHEGEIQRKLEADAILLENFLSLVERYRLYECVVHCDDVSYDADSILAFKPPTTECNHDRNVCDACLKTTFEGAIRGGRLQDLVCLDTECKKPLTLDALRMFVSAEVFKIYNKKLALNLMSKNEKFRWCACGHGQVHTQGERNPEWNCISCKQRHCYICREDSSELCQHLRSIDYKKRKQKNQQRQAAIQTFEASAQRARENEAATKLEIARTTKKCPKAGCGNKIERNEGCGHFTCRNCSTDFCWSCKVIWKNKRVLHLAGCRIGLRSTTTKASLDKNGYAPGWDQDIGYDISLDKGLWLIEGHQ